MAQMAVELMLCIACHIIHLRLMPLICEQVAPPYPVVSPPGFILRNPPAPGSTVSLKVFAEGMQFAFGEVVGRLLSQIILQTATPDMLPV